MICFVVQGVAPYDIMLIKLPAPVSMTDAVHASCLPDETDNFPSGTTCVVSGWGANQWNGSKSMGLLIIIS